MNLAAVVTALGKIEDLNSKEKTAPDVQPIRTRKGIEFKTCNSPTITTDRTNYTIIA